MGTEFPLDMDLIDHIEVVRGPGSSLFGTNAIFGVINVITRRPAGESAIEVSGDTASFLGRNGRVTGMVNRGRLSGVFSGSLYRSAGPSHLFFPEYASPETNNGFADNSDGDQFVHAFSAIDYRNFRVQALYSSRMKIIPTGSFGAIFNDPATRETDNFGQVAVGYRRKLAAATDLDVRCYYGDYSYRGIFAAEGTEPSDRVLYMGRARADWAGVEATVDRQLGRHRVTVGADYEYSFRINQWTYQAGQPLILNDQRTPWQAAIFGESELNLLSNLPSARGDVSITSALMAEP